jgi:hypothetical protein
VSVSSLPSTAQPGITPQPGTRPRTWLRRIIGGGQIVETCPSWCTASHVDDDHGMLTELLHVGPEIATPVEVFAGWSDGAPVTAPMPLLSARVQIAPYSDNPRRNVPHVELEVWQDQSMEGVTPEELAAVIARVRAHCDRLEQVHAQLVEALAEHPGAPASA